MNRELIYLFVNEVNGILFQEGLSFSNKYSIEYKLSTKELHIERHNNEDYFSNLKNINNINLIVGKNGSGKTSILNLLGSKSSEREKLLESSENNFWFALYVTDTEDFVIEGNNISMIRNMRNREKNKNTKSDEDFFIKARYDNSTKEFEFIDAPSDLEKDKLMYMYYNADLDFSWFSTKLINDRPDKFQGYSRDYIYSPNIQGIFKSIINVTSNGNDQFTAKNIEMKIEKRNITTEKDYDDIFWRENYKLYGNDKLMLLNRSKFLKNNRVYTPQEHFILEFLEECVLYKIYIDHASSSKENPLKDIKTLKLKSEEYEDRKEYLLNVLSKQHGLTFKQVKIKSGFESIVSILEGLEEELIDGNQIKVDVNENINNKNINKLIEFYDEHDEFRDVFPLHIKFSNLSNGELQYLDHFSNFLTALETVEKNSKLENVILLFDEPDANFHPEWSRKYIYNLVNELKECRSNNVKFQIIITTHSPFMISDLPRHCITCIDVLDSENGLKREILNADFGLMSNFYDLIKNNFFIKHPVGEFASEYFNEIVKSIHDLETGLKDVSEHNLQKILSQRIKDIENRINWIDDMVIKNKLKLFLEETIEKSKLKIEHIRRGFLIKKKNSLLLELSKIEDELGDRK